MPNSFQNLPKGWQLKTLGEVSKIITGKTPSKSQPEYFKGKIPFVKPNDLDKDIFIYSSEDTLTELGFKYAPFVPKNSILVSCIGNLGKKAILGINGSCNQQINAIIPNENLDYKFLYYQINILKNWLEQNASATTIKIINKSKFEKAPIILPPLQTQKLIVEKLEKAFAHIDKAIYHLNQVSTDIPRLKASLLHYAFSGKLTESNMESWQLKTLGEICTINPKNKNLDDDLEISFIPMNLIADKYQNRFSYEVKKWSEVKRGYTHLQNHCIALAKITPCFENGKCVVLENLKNGYGAGSTELIVILPEQKEVLLKFIFYFFHTTNFAKEGVKNFKGTAGQLRISVDFIANTPIPIPPLQTQKQIVQILESKFTHLENLTQFVQQSLDKLHKLKSALLTQAFKGELIC